MALAPLLKKNQLAINVRVCLNSVPLIYVSALIQSHPLLLDVYSKFEIGKLCFLILLFFFKIIFAILGPLSFFGGGPLSFNIHFRSN